MEGTIDLSLTFATELDMLNMMSFLLTNEKYKKTIDNIKIKENNIKDVKPTILISSFSHE
jgi:hypothetical protein